MYVYSDLSSVEVEHFSYDQFYVLYVKFLNLDSNQDYMLGKHEQYLNEPKHLALLGN